MSKFVGPGGTVHAFEPNPRLQPLIRSSLERNCVRNVVLHEVALGAEDAELELHIPTANLGQGSLVCHRDHPYKEVHKCRVVRLTDVVRQQRIQSLRLVKLDVEGFENEVLRGAEEVLSELRPCIIVEVIGASDVAFRRRPVIITLLRHRYQMLAVPRSALRPTVHTFDETCQSPPSHDILAVPEEQLRDVMNRFAA
jgi:FkbM family methyltransferase